MGGMQKCFIKGQGKIANDIHQLEQEYDSLINRNYTDGENSTPFTFNGKPVYVYKFNKDRNLNLPNSGELRITTGVVELISECIQIYEPFNDDDTRNKWVSLPCIQRNVADAQIKTSFKDNGEYFLNNNRITGNKKFRGYAWYTKNA